MTDAVLLRDELIALTVDRLEALERTHLPAWQVPKVFGGHRVGADVSADLVYTLGLLSAAGIDAVAATPVDDAITSVLRRVDGARTHSFFSYRIAETLARRGPFDANPLLAPLDGVQRAEVERACDSTDWIELLDAGLPRNYAAVLARCELARAQLGLAVDQSAVDDLVERVRMLVTRNPRGYLDDSEDGSGARYDIYTADLYLFCEPLAGRLGDAWNAGARNAIDLVSRVVADNGAAVVWGRSTGALALCLTVELAALAVTHRLTDEPDRWLRLARRAARELAGWFDETTGVIAAHQHRATDRYRGTTRRLQMTLDCLGKLAWSAAALGSVEPSTVPRSSGPLLPDRDELVAFDPATTAGVWSYRAGGIAFVLPLVGPIHSDYQPAAHAPGLYEQPTHSNLATWIASAYVGDARYVGAGLPISVQHEAGTLTAHYDQLVEIGPDGSRGRDLACARTVRHHVAGRTLHIDERLRFHTALPEAIAVEIPEASGRPLVVTAESDASFQLDRVDTSGLREWRSCWGELSRVHELEIEPAREVAWRLAITPAWRVATADAAHHYHRSLYAPMGERVVVRGFFPLHLQGARAGADRLATVDLFHLHWPEWFFDTDVAAAKRFCEVLDRTEVPLLWTQHNLVPHRAPDPRLDAVYEVIAEHAAGVIHHSEWGFRRASERYRYNPRAVHAVIPHPHFGNLMGDVARIDRVAAESELGLTPLPPGGLRIGVVGAPRPDKRTGAFMDAFARTERDDLELLVLSLDDGQAPPDDPRITALAYEYVDRDTYNRRLATVDVLAFPIAPDGLMLTTGVIGDAIGLGAPALVSSWPFLAEALGPAGIPMGDTVDEMTDALEHLSSAAVATATMAARALRGERTWERAAEQTLRVFETVEARATVAR